MHLRRRLNSATYPILYRQDERRTDMVRLGTEYGGWWVPRDLLGPDSICYAGGVGTDISFDLGLIGLFGCCVWGIDPTPKSITWIEGQNIDQRFALGPIGLAGESGQLRFYSPENSAHVSHSTKNIQRTSTYFTARVQTIAGLMAELGHVQLDLLKLDIEGAEHDTIRQMLADGVRPTVLCVEFDQPEPLRWGVQTAAALRKADYMLVKVDGLNLTFIHQQAQRR
jgi:FkbM family methyltransferase